MLSYGGCGYVGTFLLWKRYCIVGEERWNRGGGGGFTNMDEILGEMMKMKILKLKREKKRSKKKQEMKVCCCCKMKNNARSHECLLSVGSMEGIMNVGGMSLL